MKKIAKPLILALLVAALLIVWVLHFHSDWVAPVFSHAEWSKWLLAKIAEAPADAGGDAAADTGENEVPVHTALVSKVTFHRYIDAYGTVAPRPPRAGLAAGSAAIAAPAAGVVAEVLCQPSQKVAKGDGLIQLDDRLAKAAEDQAAAGLAEAQASLASIQTPPRPEQLRIAELAVQKSQTALNFAQKNDDRQKQLFAEQGTSDKTVQQADLDLASAQNDLAVNQAQFDLLKAGPKPSDVAQEQAKVQQAAAALAAAQTQRQLLKIVSPIDGTVMDVNVNPGEAVDMAKTLVDVVDLDHLTVDADLPAAQLPGLSLGQAVVVLPTGAAADAGVGGKIAFIAPQIESKTGTVQVSIDLDPGSSLRTGLAVAVKIVVEERKDKLGVPLTSVVTTDDGKTIVNVVKDDTASHKEVKTGLTENDLIEIDSPDIKEGDTVVTAGAYGLPDATKVKVSN